MPRCDVWRAASATSRVHRVADRKQLLPSPGERPPILDPQPRRDPDAGGHVDRAGATQRWELAAAR